MQLRYIISFIIPPSLIVLVFVGPILWFDGGWYIRTYEPARHRESVLDILKQNRFWLVPKAQKEAQQDNYSSEYQIDFLSPTSKTEDIGSPVVKVYKDEGKLQV